MPGISSSDSIGLLSLGFCSAFSVSCELTAAIAVTAITLDPTSRNFRREIRPADHYLGDPDAYLVGDFEPAAVPVQVACIS